MARTNDEVVKADRDTPIRTGAQYIDSLRGRNLNVYLLGERVSDPVDHPVIRPSINAVAETYDLAERSPDLGTAVSPYTGERINRFPSSLPCQLLYQPAQRRPFFSNSLAKPLIYRTLFAMYKKCLVVKSRLGINNETSISRPVCLCQRAYNSRPIVRATDGV